MNHVGRGIGRGFRAALPLALGCMPFGVAYGAVARQAMAPWQAGLMSVAVFAGTAQFVGASMLAQGAAFLPVALTALLLNARLLLLSAAWAPHLRQAPRAAQPLLAQMLTDESFAASLAEFERHPQPTPERPWFAIGTGLVMFTCWQIATWTGIGLGQGLPAGWGLEYALPASLICLLFLLVRGARAAAVAGLAAVLALALRPLVTPMWSTLAGTLLAVTAGTLLWRRR